MASVSVTINGRKYRMGCEPGQEQEIIELADGVNRRIEALRHSLGEIGDQMLLAMASIYTANELAVALRRIGSLEEAVDSLQKRGAADEQRQEASDAELARAIGNAARQVADLARRINAED